MSRFSQSPDERRARQRSPSLTVVSYNVRHAELAPLSAIIAQLDALKPDLLAVQELDCGTRRSRRSDQPAEISRALGLTPVFCPTLPFDGGTYGHALFSRWPVLWSEIFRLPSSEEPRALLRARVAAPGGSLEVGATHLGLDAETRRRQVEVLRPHLATLGLLLGDFNEAPGGRVHASLTRPLVDALKGAGSTYPAPRPLERIDGIFYAPDLGVPLGARVVPSQLSDHFAVLVQWDILPAMSLHPFKPALLAACLVACSSPVPTAYDAGCVTPCSENSDCPSLQCGCPQAGSIDGGAVLNTLDGFCTDSCCAAGCPPCN